MNQDKLLANKLPWYTISLLITILGALSILLLFGVYHFGTTGILFWIIVSVWVIILISATMEISRLEALQKQIIKKYQAEIKELREQLKQQ